MPPHQKERKMKVECPCCSEQHEVKRVLDCNWFGTTCDGEWFAVAWCPDAGREVGDWVPETEHPVRA